MKLTVMTYRLADAWRTRAGPALERANAVWKQRTRREQALLRGVALVLSVALLWLIGLRPALNTVRQAHRQLPELQASSAQLEGILLEARALSRSRLGVLSVSETEEALQAALRDGGLEGVSALNRLAGSDPKGTHWQIMLTNAPSAQVMAWLASLTFTAQVRTRQLDLMRSNVDGRDRPGMLSGVIVLAYSAREAP